MGIDIKSIADLLRTFSVQSAKKHRTTAVILAAGRGERFGDSVVRKQHFEIAGIPTVVRSILAFDRAETITDIVIVAPAEDKVLYEAYRAKYNIKKPMHYAVGGDTRQESAMSGLNALNDKTEFVAIHDAARCLITPKLIDETVREAYMSGAAIAAERAIDTVKLATADGTIESTPDRNTVWQAKTPQVFLANMYRAAAYTALRDGYIGTDDASLAERLGFKVKLVDCGHGNIKITTQDDVLMAENLLALRESTTIEGLRLDGTVAENGGAIKE